MPEWWSYSLSDFLLFSPRTYYRLIQRHNETVWPAQIATIGLGLVIAGLLRRPVPWRGRAISAILAGLLGWVAWAFIWRRYAPINWAMKYLVWLLAIEALLLLWVGAVRGRLDFRWRRGAREAAGVALFKLSLVVYPVLAPLFHRGWRQSEIFGIAPDPTVVATLGLLLLDGTPPRWGLLVAPVLWCLVSGATLLAMGSPQAWVVLSAAVLSVGASAWAGRSREPGI